jgi:hypothetical protein
MGTFRAFATRLARLMCLALLSTLPAQAGQPEGVAAGGTPTHSLGTPDNFGIQSNVTILGASDFNPQGNATYAYSGTGYIESTGGDGIFWAPVHLPNGVVVTELCIWYYNSEASDGILAEWAAYGLGQNTTAPIYHPFNSFQLEPAGGYDVTCVNPGNVIHGWTDLDGNLTNEYPAYRVAVYLGGGATQRVGGVYLQWHYQVSPAPVAPTFNDVPPADFGFQYIEALVASGITGGTGGGNYSPDAFVTRRQMAIFIAKALGLYWPF